MDSASGPAVAVDSLITTDDGEFYGAPGYRVTAMTGTRGADAISFDPSTFNDEIYFPGDAGGNYVDGFGLDFMAGGVIYNLYRNGSGDFAYHEFDGAIGRLIADRNISLTLVDGGSVPEPATWAMMVGGFGIVGAAMRRRKRPSVTYA